jgi:hypothetical protein
MRMAMVLKTRQQLAALALEEMRRYPQCGALDNVDIRTDLHGVWFIAPQAPTSSFTIAVQRAAVKAQIALRPRYDLAP